MNNVFAPERGREPIRLAEIADFSLGELRVRPSLREIERSGTRDQLEPRVMQVFVALATAEGAVVSRDDLIARCWDGRIVGEAAINRCISMLRDLSETSGAFTIETIPRVGYRLMTPAMAPPATVPASKAKTERVDASPVVATALTSRFRGNAPYFWSAIALVAVLSLLPAIYESHRPLTAKPSSSMQPVQASIAVLPFKNLSSDKDAGYLADGVQDEILTRLAKIGSLKVISRTSTEQFASHAPGIRDIARKLGVANVLEGNVQTSRNRIRINVQLIRAANDTHLWAEDYDRKFDDILSVESDVAGTIARVLAAKMTAHERVEIASKPTSNPQAYNLYLRALAFANRSDPISLQTATQLLTQATRLDPKFALAWSRLARNEAYRHFGDDLVTVRKGSARAALTKALAEQPDLAEAQVAKGFYLYYGEMNYPAAERELRLVNARWPNNAEAMEALALILRRLGKWKESTVVLEKLVRVDPLSLNDRTLLAGEYQILHDFPRSLAVLDAALQIWPDNGSLLSMKADVLQGLGQLDAADAVLKNVRVSPDGDGLDVIMAQFWMKRQYAKGAAYFRGLLTVEQQGQNRDSVTFMLRITIGEFLHMEGDATDARENYSAALMSIERELKAQPGNKDFVVPLCVVYAGLGETAKSLALGQELIRNLRNSNDALDLIGAETVYAHLIARLGDRTAAIAEIAHAVKPPSALTPSDLRLEPDFDRLRGDPLFEALAHGDTTTTAN